MKDHPMLFSGLMVRAQIEERKTQTRRAIKFAGVEHVHDFVKVATDKQGRSVYEMKDRDGKALTRPAGKHLVDYHFSPRIAVGDRIWVRETLCVNEDWGVWYDAHGGIGPSKADFLPEDRSQPLVDRYAPDDGETFRNIPSIFMPRWASRLTLTVTDVRIERLQDISEEDAVAEGVEVASADPEWLGYRDYGNDRVMNPTAKGSYRTLWDRINGAGAWANNPWVIAYGFEVERRNIDEVGA